MIDPLALSPERPVLLAGPTASGKSALAERLARAQGRLIVNADALQVHACWRVLTARPSAAEEAALPHALYGHVGPGQAYSVGHWLRDLAPILARAAARGPAPVIVGGTGLYFRALTEGLAEIPPVPDAVRAEAGERPLPVLVAELAAGDPDLARRIDLRNRARVQRGWEVLRATGRPLSAWQDATPPPLLPLGRAHGLLVEAGRDWLDARIARRFARMLAGGALEEARAILPLWDRAGGARKAIGAAELVAHLRGAMPLEAARAAAILASRQYAKRQRTWVRAQSPDWRRIPAPEA